MEQQIVRAAAPEGRTAAVAPESCGKCDQHAVCKVMWDWGEVYNACARHQALATQINENLTGGDGSRRVSFVALAHPEAPLTRSERAKLKGEVYACEMEIADLKGRGTDLYNENVALTRQLQALTVRNRETELQLQDEKQRAAQLELKLEERDAEHGNLVDELTRLRTLVKFQEERPSVVDGDAPTEVTHGVQGAGWTDPRP